MASKKYFWLKLKDDFFNQKEIKMLRRIAGGDTYTIVYLKMLLLSLKTDGKIYYDGIAENMVEEIALEIDEDSENVQITFNYLHQKGLIEFSDDELEMINIASMIGSETDSARRVRKHREKKTLQSNGQETKVKHLGNGEIEKEIELEKELDIELEQETEEKLIGDVVVEYESLGFGIINQNKTQQLEEWVDYFDADVVIKALQVADNQNKSNMNYVNGILRNWKKRNLDTVEKIEAEQRRFENTQQLPKNAQKQGEQTPEWMNKQQDNSPVDTTEIKTAAEDPEISDMIQKFRNG